LSTTDKLLEKIILWTIQKHTEDRNLLSASQFGFWADHSMTLHCMRLADHVIVNFNNNMLTAGVFFSIEKAFNTTWHPDLMTQRPTDNLALLKSWCLRTNIKLPLYSALIRSVVTYAFPTWDYAMDTHLLKLQRLQNRVHCAIGNLDRCTPVC
jgi:hypothetical protein